MKNKICICCKTEKSIIEFYDNYINDVNYFASKCKTCLSTYFSERVICNCGSIIMRKNMPRHKKTNIHNKKILVVAAA